jgi:hypothetical protein
MLIEYAARAVGTRTTSCPGRGAKGIGVGPVCAPENEPTPILPSEKSGAIRLLRMEDLDELLNQARDWLGASSGHG